MIDARIQLSNTELLATLATRERQVFDFIVKGMRTKEISDELKIKANTVSTIKKVIFRKLKINSSLEFYKFVFEQKAIEDNV